MEDLFTYLIGALAGVSATLFVYRKEIFGSNERKSVRKHEQKEEKCNCIEEYKESACSQYNNDCENCVEFY